MRHNSNPQYVKFRDAVNSHMPNLLPDDIGHTHFVMFRDNWAVEIIQSIRRADSLSDSMTGSSRSWMRQELAPLLSRLGIGPLRDDFVLYLRPLSVDRTQVVTGVDRFKATEKALIEALDPIGPVLTVGRMQEKPPDVGTTHVYFHDQEWQARIAPLMSRAKLCVVMLGAFPSAMKWELAECAARVSPQRLILWPPSGTAYAAVRQQLNDVLPGGLPIELPRKSFIMFDEAWQPKVIGAGHVRSHFVGNCPIVATW